MGRSEVRKCQAGNCASLCITMVRLTNKPNAKIEEIGSPEKLISALGPFVTGNSYDPDEVVETHVETRGDQTVSLFIIPILHLLLE